MDKWRVDADRVPWIGRVRLWLTYHNGETWRILETSDKDFDMPGEEPDPTAIIPEGAAQQLIDALWRAGLRPSEGTGSAGALAATQKHLDDMRRLVFDAPTPVMATLEERISPAIHKEGESCG